MLRAMLLRVVDITNCALLFDGTVTFNGDALCADTHGAQSRERQILSRRRGELAEAMLQ